MKLKNVYYLGGKEFFSFMRDHVLIIFIIHSFTTGIYIASTSRPETMQNVPIAIVDEDKSQLSNRLVSSFYPPYFKTPVMISHEEMDKGMDHGDYTFSLNIPASFEKDVLSGDRPKIQLNVDATRMTQAFSGSGYVQQIVQKELGSYLSRGQKGSGMPVEISNRTAFNPELNKSWFSSVLEIINRITLLSIVLTGAALIREREHGTIEHLMVMPVTPFEILASKIWPMAVIVLIGSLFSLTVMVQWILDIPIKGSLVLFLFATTLHLFAATSLGIFMSTVTKTMPQFGLLLMMVILPLQLLSGGSTPRESMPQLIQDIMLLAPNTHFVIISQSILFKGAGFDIIWKNLLALSLIATVLFTVSIGYSKKFMRS